ncbi:hypothetical protein WJR50_13060 [Catalinimonas sp. 4WD22]|uniref:hypothetical protein n=1 Tax=Catalinimonas locisalis TaxID=3133978 RepID=UPI00310190A5
MKALAHTSLLVTILFFLQHTAFAQLGVSYHQSGLSFIGVQYNFSEAPIMAEFRLSTDNFLENATPELVGTYGFINKEQHQVYAGLGLRVNRLEGVVIPLGLKVYPLKDFAGLGLHMELAPIIYTEEDGGTILRGSWGFHYIFGRNKE